MTKSILLSFFLGIIAFFCLLKKDKDDRTKPKFQNQISWEKYLGKLRPEDGQSVREICVRLTTFSRYHKMPLAVLAIGSVLNPKGNQLYRNIDLLLLPLNSEDLNFAEHLFARFIVSQKEVDALLNEGNHVYLPEEKKWSRPSEESRYWTLRFSYGRTVNIFILTGEGKANLRGIFEKKNAAAKDSRAYAYKIFRA